MRVCILCQGLLLLLCLIIADSVDTDQKLGNENQPQATVGSGDLLPMTLGEDNATYTVQKVELEQVFGRLEQLSSHLHKVEQLIQNQTVELQATLKQDLEHMYGDAPENYKKKPTKEKDFNEVNEKDSKKPFVFYSDEASDFRFYGDNSSLSQDFEGWCNTNHVAGFGPPKTHAWIYLSGADLGAWLKDPLPRHPSERSEIWIQRRASHVDDRYTFRSYNSYSHFQSHKEASRRERAWWIHGVGSVIYNGAVHFHYQNHMYRYDIRTEERPVQLLMTSDYTRGHHTYVRYHTDESGLWVSYPKPDRFRLMLSKVNPDTLELSKTVTLENDISRVKGVWMICGQVYLLFANGTHGQHVAQAVYDVHSGTVLHGKPHNVGLLYGYISQMTYNPREKVIFGWDNYHLLTWPVIWQKHGLK